MMTAALRQREAAMYCGVTEPTFRKWQKEDPNFPAPLNLGKRSRMYLVRDLDAWLESRRIKA